MCAPVAVALSWLGLTGDFGLVSGVGTCPTIQFLDLELELSSEQQLLVGEFGGRDSRWGTPILGAAAGALSLALLPAVWWTVILEESNKLGRHSDTFTYSTSVIMHVYASDVIAARVGVPNLALFWLA